MKKLRLIQTVDFLAIAIFLIALLSSGCSRGTQNKTVKENELKGTISLSGAFALYPMTVKWAEEFMKKYPQVRIDISAGGAGKGMTDALSGMVDLGMFSRGVSQEEIDKGAWFIAVTKDAVLPTINADNPVKEQLMKRGFKKSEFMELFLDDKPRTWGEYTDGNNRDQVNVYTRSDACGAAEMWGKYLGKNQESLKGVGVFGDPGIAEAIKNDINGIGFNNVAYAFDMRTRQKYQGLEVLPIDINENGQIDPEENVYTSLDVIIEAIRTGIYPSPPARDLYLVSKGLPENPVAIAFIEWILTEGQQYVNEAGYVQLAPEKIESERSKLTKKE